MEIFVCGLCGRMHLEQAGDCAHCGGETKRMHASGRGVVHTFSEVHMGVKGMPTPYTLALVELEEGGRILARLEEVRDATPAIGDAVVFAGVSDAGAVFRRL